MGIRVGMIGLGRMAERAYLPVLANKEGVELEALMSRRGEVVERLAAQYHVPYGVTDRDELLKHNLDAVVVLTPSPTHYEIVKWLLESGVDVLVEKPLTMASEQAAELADVAEQRGRVLMVAFNRRYAPFYRRAKELMEALTVSLIIAEKHRERAVNPSLFDQYSEEDIHLIDLLRWFGGEAHALGTGSIIRKGKLVDAASLISFESGGIGVLAASLEAGGWLERVTLHGEKVTVQVDAFQQLRILNGDEDKVWGRELAGSWTSSLEVRGFAPLVEHFAHCVRTRETPLTSATEAYKTQRLMEEMVAKGSSL